MDRVKTGTFETPNPYNNRIKTTEVTPDTVHSIVFWSKNFDKFIRGKYGETLISMGFNLFFNFTINSENTLFEPNLPPLHHRLEQMNRLANQFGPETINWRFDPIYSYNNASETFSNLDNFNCVAENIGMLNIKRCFTSFVDVYQKVARRLSLYQNLTIVDLSPQEKIDALLRMEDVLSYCHINLFLCCEPEILSKLPRESAIRSGSCIDTGLLQSLFGDKLSQARDTGQRTQSGCGCKKSHDIGVYNLHPCKHNCLYCYANPVAPTHYSGN